MGRRFKAATRHNTRAIASKTHDRIQSLAMEIQSNFSGSNTFGTMKISSRQG